MSFDSDVFDNVGSGIIPRHRAANVFRIRQGHVSALLRESLESSDSGLNASTDDWGQVAQLFDKAPPSATIEQG